jgi:hypothetical protein
LRILARSTPTKSTGDAARGVRAEKKALQGLMGIGLSDEAVDTMVTNLRRRIDALDGVGQRGSTLPAPSGSWAAQGA